MALNRWTHCLVIGIQYRHKENETLPFVLARMDLEAMTLSEISQREKDK